MPFEFLSDEQVSRYGRFPQEPSAAELEQFFRLDQHALKRAAMRRRPATKLGWAVQWGTVRMLGVFLTEDPTAVPSGVVAFVAEQLGVDPACFTEYGQRQQTVYEHAWEIRELLGYAAAEAGVRRFLAAQADIDIVATWGGGQIASADGLRFVVPVANLHTGHNPIYFGRQRGATWLNVVNDQVMGIGGLVVPGTLRDSLFILDAIHTLDGGQRPETVITDTASYSDIVFGLFAICGYQFSPRIADLADTRLWRTNTRATYGPLDHMSRHTIRLDKIRAHWADMLRVAGSLTMGTGANRGGTASTARTPPARRRPSRCSARFRRAEERPSRSLSAEISGTARGVRRTAAAESGRARMSYRRAAELFTAATATCPGEPWTLHQLRHSALTHAAEDGANTSTLLAFPGHTNVASVARYARVSGRNPLPLAAATRPGPPTLRSPHASRRPARVDRASRV